MRNSIFALLFGLALPWLTFAEDEYVPGTVNSSEETYEDQGDKQIIRRKSGKVKAREGEPRVGEIYDEDTDRIQKRIKSKDFSSFFFGPASSEKIGNRDMLYTASLGKHWEVSPQSEMRVVGRGAFNNEGQILTLGLGGSYIPNTSSVSPIFGAELGYGYILTKIDGENFTKGGFEGGVHGGVRFFRIASTQMELSAHYNVLFVEGSPGMAGLSLGILY